MNKQIHKKKNNMQLSQVPQRIDTTFFTYAGVLPKTFKHILMYKIGEVTL